METNSKNSAKVGYVKRILIVDAAMLIIAGIISLVLNFQFWDNSICTRNVGRRNRRLSRRSKSRRSK